eukprot:m.58491 g.58491  ORF g.58491 m.58491 type:complete len:53 (+) comp11265_c0_seq1:187-345(+)
MVTGNEWTQVDTATNEMIFMVTAFILPRGKAVTTEEVQCLGVAGIERGSWCT